MNLLMVLLHIYGKLTSRRPTAKTARDERLVGLTPFALTSRR